MSDSQIACIERHNGDRLIVKFGELNGAHYCHVRVHYVNEKGVVIPTKTGIAIRCDEIFLIHDAIGKACELAMRVKR